MTDERRGQVFALIQAHLADELDVDPDTIGEQTRFKEDLEADSLDLYTLVQELEDTYGVEMSMSRRHGYSLWGRRSTSVGPRRGRRCAAMSLLAGLLEELPERLERQVFTHASWSERRSDSYARLAFLGDSVLALAVTTHLYPRLEAERFGRGGLRRSAHRRYRGCPAGRSQSAWVCPSACDRRRLPAFRRVRPRSSGPSACLPR